MIGVIGDLLLDIFLLPGLTRAEQSGGIAVRGGGSAANTAAWIAKLGHLVTFVGCVGDDAPGRMLVGELRAAGVRCRVRWVAEAETGVVAVEVTPDGERVMRSSRGANMDLSPNDVARLSRAKPTLVHLAGYSLLGPFGLEILRSAGRLAQSTGARLSFDPSSPGLIELFRPEPLLDAMVAAGVEILLPNAEEAHALIGARTPETAAAQLAGSIPVVIVKDGSRGAVYSTAGVTQRVPVDPLQPLDTTGAGDAFNAGVLAALVEQKTLAVACLQAHETARRVLRHCGGRP